MLLLPLFDDLLASFMLGIELLLLIFRRNVELKILFCDVGNKESLSTGPAGSDSFSSKGKILTWLFKDVAYI